MTQNPRMTLSGIVLDAPDARVLAAFYRRLLGWTVEQDEPGWVKLSASGGGPGLSLQTEAAYVRPTWPAGPGDQQMVSRLCSCAHLFHPHRSVHVQGRGTGFGGPAGLEGVGDRAGRGAFPPRRPR